MKKQKELPKGKSVHDLQAEICSALANPVRLKILDILGNGEKTSGDLLEELQIPKANLSQHLSVLKDAGILHTRKEGLFQYVSLALPKIKDACTLVRNILSEKMAIDEKQNLELMKELRAKR
ncbi:MAG: metalloregulator ArsR/SmtB family transcription factor [Endomicrobia bacterium]|nr:metalloregulator ArsR/SmtB family transcription factor [Endomicrobiia bacterium]